MEQGVQIYIADLGSQYTTLIGRELLKLGYRSAVLKPEAMASAILAAKPRGIILSGGAKSVYDADAPHIAPEIFSAGCPVLGICYGMHYLAYRKDPSLVQGGRKEGKEYGPAEVSIAAGRLFEGVPKKLKVWASHGDAVETVPPGYAATASAGSVIEAMESEAEKIYAVQFHPEVLETEDDGKILENFVKNICGCAPDWQSTDAIAEIRKETAAAVGRGRAAIGVSGGVDSTTLAAVLAPALGERLFAFFIDTGAMREGEVEQVSAACRRAGIDLHVVDARAEFFKNLAHSTDAEEKRAKFKEAYQLVYKKIVAENDITHILQGTLATDLIESGHQGQASTIKSHHNVGLDFGVAELAPFSGLFKYEVRELARAVGLDREISERKPFPGPGLFVRVVGVPPTEELVAQVRTADRIVNDILKREPFYADISQVVVALLGAKTVGVQGDYRTYQYPIVVRAVSTTDFMTVRGFEIPPETRRKIISEVTRHGFNRVFFDETPKPPATTEME